MNNWLPVHYYFAWLLLAISGVYFWSKRTRGWAIPAMATLATIAAWYLIDPLYNDYEKYFDTINVVSLDNAWWQVNLFLVSFACLVPQISSFLTGKYGALSKSTALTLVENRIFETLATQQRMERLLLYMTIAWLVLMSIALYRVRFDYQGLFAPYLAYKVDPWMRDRIGTGFDFLLSIFYYFQIFLTAGFGVLAALLKRPGARSLAVLICFLGFPYYIFDRTRSAMLAAVIPGVLCWGLFRIQGSLLKRFSILACIFLLINSWMLFVMSNRSERAISAAFAEGGFRFSDKESAKHGGLNMYEELAWINSFIDEGKYKINWGERYFAEIVNPIPRTIWPSKPLIGIDYAIARGQGGGQDSSAGVYATISTGLIGQGVVNFGQFFGPIFAALLMSIWCGVLARLDLHGSPSSILLLAIGLILTFNLGRDITLLNIYPFVFGWIAITIWEWNSSSKNYRSTPVGPGRRQREDARASKETFAKPPGLP